MIGSEIDVIFDALSHKTRREIIRILGSRGAASYSDLLRELKLETGVLNYHLSKLEGLVEKVAGGSYRLTSTGYKAYKVLLYAEGGLELSSQSKSPLYYLSVIYVNPHKAFAGDEYAAVASAILAILHLLLLTAYTGDLLDTAVLMATPLATSIAIAYLLYGRRGDALRKGFFNYGFSLAPLIAYPPLALVLTLLAPHRVLELRTALSVVVTVLYLLYNILYAKHSYGLDTSQSIVVAIATLLALKYAVQVLGPFEYPSLLLP